MTRIREEEDGAVYVLKFVLLTSFSIIFSELSLVGLALDLVD